MDNYEVIKNHTIKKIEIVSEYAKGWAYKILGYEFSEGLIYIDCMSNRGMYLDKDENLVEGTAIRVARIINEINKNHNKNAILFFNDIDNNKVECLKRAIGELDLQYVKIRYFNLDANELLKKISSMGLGKYNTLLFYDPYQADIDWEALDPYFNTWGEVIINHMVSDVIRGAKSVINPKKIAKYEKTYQKNISEIIDMSNSDNNREEFEKITNSIIASCVSSNDKGYYIASFPFYIKTNQLIYNLIYFSWNNKGMNLFKKTAWNAFGDQSSIKHATATDTPGQLSLDLDTGTFKTDSKPGVYTIYDVAKYIYLKYGKFGEVSCEQIYDDLEKHPIFPCEGYKPKIKKELKESFGVDIKKNSIVFRRG